MLSMRKPADFLPAGKDFTIPARNFLPVGKGLRDSPAKATKRHDGRDVGHNGGKTISGKCDAIRLPNFRVARHSGIIRNIHEFASKRAETRLPSSAKPAR